MIVQTLGKGGWHDAGDYRPDRAREVADLLRKTELIVRLEDELPPRPRIGWRYEDNSGAWLGTVDGITMFVLIPPPARAAHHGYGTWMMYVLLPGYQNDTLELRSQPDAEDTAEQVLDKFQWRIGVRGYLDTSAAGPDNTTLVLPTLADEEDQR